MKKLPAVAHKTPCKECPFRRCAPAGWLGGGTVADWYQGLVLGFTVFLCHMAEKKNKRHYCAGSMIHYRNSLKLPPLPAVKQHLEEFLPDHAAVFSWPHEFKAHHEAGPLALTAKDKHIKQIRP